MTLSTYIMLSVALHFSDTVSLLSLLLVYVPNGLPVQGTAISVPEAALHSTEESLDFKIVALIHFHRA